MGRDQTTWFIFSNKDMGVSLADEKQSKYPETSVETHVVQSP